MGIRDSLDEQGLAPRKRWGQNFLTDPRILASIADAATVASSDTILEIGPGLGHLTRTLASRAGRVVAVEIDPQLAEKLRIDMGGLPNVKITQGDILDRAPSDWVEDNRFPRQGTIPYFKIVANLPYYITSAILRHVLEAPVRPGTVVVMVQREVAQRIVAKPPQMSLLAVSVQYHASVQIVRTIAAGAFFPRPKVVSAVVRLDVYGRSPFEVANTNEFFGLARAGFGEKRKQLRNSLSKGLGIDPVLVERLLARVRIDPKRRAETLSLDEWHALYVELTRMRPKALSGRR